MGAAPNDTNGPADGTGRRRTRRSGSSASAPSATGWPPACSAPGAPGGLRHSARGHRPVSRDRATVADVAGRPGRRRPTWWWWRWSTTTRSTPCCPAPTGLLAAARAPAPPSSMRAAPSSSLTVRPGHRRRGRRPRRRRCSTAASPAARRPRPTGELVCMVGGDPAVIERVGPVFDAIGSLTVTMGPFGSRSRGQAGPQPGAPTARGWPPTRARCWPRRPASTWPAGPGGQGQRPTDRGRVEAHVPAHRGAASPTPTTRGWSGPCGRPPSLAHKDLAAALRTGRGRSTSNCPWPAMTEDRCDADLRRRTGHRCPWHAPDDPGPGAGEERLLIDGELRPARSGRTFETVNPATEEVLGVVADAGPEDLDDAIAAARRAFDETGWSTDVELRVAGSASCRPPSSPTPTRSGP